MRWWERISEWTGKAAAWASLGMILLGAYNAIVRYLGRFTGAQLASNTLIEAQWYLFSVLFLLGAAWTLKEDAHVRVDVFYGRLGERGKAWVDLLGTLFFLLPFCAFGIYTSWAPVAEAWRTLEVSPDPGGLPRYPIKTLLPVAFALLILQGLVIAAKKVQVLRGRSP
jgi:TRAP-type mannitol/chloroaromatic compound transport system permease small subunit